MFEYLWSVWQAIQLGLEMHPDVMQIVESHPHANWIGFGVVMAAGISLLLGQSVILFLNQVRPARFVASLLTNGVLLVIGWIIWSAIVWLTGNWLFPQPVAFVVVLSMIGLSYAPLVFGFLILMPYLGPFVQHVLYVWSFIIALRSVAFTYQVDFWPAHLCVGIGWILLMILTSTIGRPIVALRNRLWQSITKTSKNAPLSEILKQFAYEQSDATKPKGE